jgi:hypothetical protein
LTGLSPAEFEELSFFRVKVEHAVGRVKIFRMVKKRYRCHKLFLMIWFLKWLVDCLILDYRLA